MASPRTSCAACPPTIVGGPAAQGAPDAHEAIERLRAVYCGTTGHDYNHVFVPEEREWLRRAVESSQFRPPNDPIGSRELLNRITQVESFERFLHRTFPGKTRFSIEGLDMMIPVLDEIISDAAAAGVKHVMIAMAHRGRLNVLAHTLQKPYEQILAEFKDPLFSRSWRVDLGWMGDVKYHAGARVERRGDRPDTLVVSMPPNPSHLEAVDPVLNGMARAAATDVDQPGPPRFRKEQVLAILIHGDSAFPGQGVVAETLNLSRLAGYDVGGIIHIIANNQLGFTAEPHESFSTSYASGLARGFKIPITHVNADDPVACIEAARLAWAYRQRFGLDYLIDLVGYRRYGHNEGDEPAFTQPQIYQLVTNHPTVRELYARALAESGEVPAADAEAMVQQHFGSMERAYAGMKPEQDFIPPLPEIPPTGAAQRAVTAVPLERLRAINDELLSVPAGFTVHRKLERGRERRKQMFESPAERTVDWAAAEELAYASILADGVPIRLTGEDVERGTFIAPPRRVSRRRDRRRVRAAALVLERPGGVRDPQQPAHRERHHRVRVRLQHPGAEPAGAVGRPVRRLHQRRAGDPRRVPHLGPREVGAGAVAGAAAAARLRRPGTGSLERAARALPERGRRHQHADRELHHRGAVLPPAPPPGAAAHHRPAAAHRA